MLEPGAVSENPTTSQGNLRTVRRIHDLFRRLEFERVRGALVEHGDDPAALAESLGEFGEVALGSVDAELEIDLLDSSIDFVGLTTARGLDGWISFWRAWLEPWEGFTFVDRDWEAIGPHVVFDITLRARGRSSGAPVEWTQTQVWTLREGRIVSVRFFDRRADALRSLTTKL